MPTSLTPLNGPVEAINALQTWLSNNTANLTPVEAEEALNAAVQVGQSPVDALIKATQTIYDNKDTLPTDLVALGASMLNPIDLYNFHGKGASGDGSAALQRGAMIRVAKLPLLTGMSYQDVKLDPPASNAPTPAPTAVAPDAPIPAAQLNNVKNAPVSTQ
jgi:hypothetical protein